MNAESWKTLFKEKGWWVGSKIVQPSDVETFWITIDLGGAIVQSIPPKEILNVTPEHLEYERRHYNITSNIYVLWENIRSVSVTKK